MMPVDEDGGGLQSPFLLCVPIVVFRLICSISKSQMRQKCVIRSETVASIYIYRYLVRNIDAYSKLNSIAMAPLGTVRLPWNVFEIRG